VKFQSLSLAVLLVVAFVLGGCVSNLSGFPERPETLEGFDKYFRSTVLDQYNQIDVANEPIRRAKRDEIIGGQIIAINKVFGALERTLSQSAAAMSIGTDMAVLGLNAAASVVGGASLKAALAATSGGLIGAKGSIDKNLFYEKTLPVLLSEMRASRKATMVRIRRGLTLSTTDYSLSAAMTDVGEYFFSGSIPGAIAAISANTGTTAKDADAKLNQVVDAKYLKDDSSIALRRFWKPDGININTDNEAALKKWMAENDVDTSITFFLVVEKFAAKRAQAVKELIPE
jgi:hypothetical protein